VVYVCMSFTLRSNNVVQITQGKWKIIHYYFRNSEIIIIIEDINFHSFRSLLNFKPSKGKWCPLRCSVRLYLQLFLGELISYLRYLCLFPYSGVQCILCWVFFLSFLSPPCVLCCQFLWIVHFWWPLRYSLMFI
jgi:hypothetical protein